MKSCPKCKRTYADDGFTFCLEDGALLSAPYDPEETQKRDEASAAPPTIRISNGADQKEPSAAELVPTIAARPPSAPLNQVTSPRIERTQPGKSKLPYIVVSLAVALVVIGGVVVYGIRQSQCRQFEVVCFPYGNRASCQLTEKDGSDSHARSAAISSLTTVLAFQEAARAPSGIFKVKWSSSSGTIGHSSDDVVDIDTTGLAGRQITVTATFEGAGWGCSKTATGTFAAQ